MLMPAEASSVIENFACAMIFIHIVSMHAIWNAICRLVTLAGYDTVSVSLGG